MKQEDFDEYIRQVEPSAQQSAADWQTAIGLQQVDGLKPSQYLLDVAQRNIDGDISIDEVRQLLDSYYSSKSNRSPEDDDAAECDKASANIKKILSTNTFAFNTNGFISTHRRIFDGVFKHAGQLRKFDITKKEWVLRGDTVNYLNWEDLRRAIDYDIQQEREFSYKDLSKEDKVRHICNFVSGLWQIHPFCEGNTRTTAVFTIQYLRSMKYSVTNDLFKNHSWYFRNALVRANYKNVRLGIDFDISFLERFFRNLLMGENNVLKNRYMLIDAPDGWKSTDDKPEELTFPEEGELYGQDSSTDLSQAVTSLSQVCHKLEKKHLNNAAKTLIALSNIPLSLKVLMESVGESNRGRMKDNVLVPLFDAGLIKLTIPDIPNSPKQKYALTEKGKELFQS